MFDISKKYDFVIKEMEVDKDHIHLMIESEPKVSPLMIVRVLKQQCTTEMWRIYIRKSYQNIIGLRILSSQMDILYQQLEK